MLGVSLVEDNSSHSFWSTPGLGWPERSMKEGGGEYELPRPVGKRALDCDLAWFIG